MSFFNKIIDRAKHGNSKGEEIAKPSDQLKGGDSNRSFFGVHTPHSSTSSSSHTIGTDHHQQQQLPKVQEEATLNNHYANGYVTPRQSQDSPQQMDIDTPSKFF